MPKKNEGVEDDFFGNMFDKAGTKEEDLEEVVVPVEEETVEVSVVPMYEYERMKGHYEDAVDKYRRAIVSLRETCEGYRSAIESMIEEGEENSK